MKPLTFIYNKNKDEQPIKSSQPACHIEIDHRNNVSESFLLEDYQSRKIFSLMLLEWIGSNKVALSPDGLTAKFNDPELQLIDLKEYLIQQSWQNKLLQADRLTGRIRHLNQQFLTIKSFGIAKQLGAHPNITILLFTGHLLTLRNRDKEYQCITKQPLKSVKAFKYIKYNTLAIVTDQLIIANDTSYQIFYKQTLSYRVNIIQVINLQNVTKLVLATVDKIIIHTLNNYINISTQYIKVSNPITFIQCCPINKQLLYLASISNYYSLDTYTNHLNMVDLGTIQDQKVVLHDSVNFYTTLNFRQNAITKLLIQSQSGLYISFSYDIGRTFKELDMMIATSNQYQILKHSLLSVYHSYIDKGRPLNLHDLRMLQNKQTLLELEKIVLILNDNDLTTVGKNSKQKKLNKDILDTANHIIQLLKIHPQAIIPILEKLLIHILLVSGESKKPTFRQLILQIVRKRFDKLSVDTNLAWKRCMFSYSKLKNGDLLECIQCKLIGNKQSSQQQIRCYACWGQFKLIQAF